MDLIREMLLWFEERPERLIILNEIKIFRGDQELTLGHLALLNSAGFVEESSKHCWRVTWEGHEFLDKIRDDEIWRKTKEGASKLNSWGVKLIGDLATGYLKAKAAELGLPIL